jgi:hypothetical protein
MAGEDNNNNVGWDGNVVICDGMDTGIVTVAPTPVLASLSVPANAEEDSNNVCDI